MASSVNRKRRHDRKVLDSEEFASFILRIIRSQVRRAVDDGDLEALGDLAALRRDIDVAIERAAHSLMTDHLASYAEIGAKLGITRQAVQKRYPQAAGRTVGGQPGNLR